MQTRPQGFGSPIAVSFLEGLSQNNYFQRLLDQWPLERLIEMAVKEHFGKMVVGSSEEQFLQGDAVEYVDATSYEIASRLEV